MSDISGVQSPTPRSLLLSHRANIATCSIRDLVDRLLASDDRLESIAAMSYAHDNGFEKLVLDCGTGWKLRFHYWPEKESNLDDANIHNHRWDFASAVVLGELHAYYYEITNCEGGDFSAYKYSSPETADRYDFDYLGTVRPTLEHEETLPTGYSYGLGYMRSHRVSVVTAPAATLVLQGPVRSNSTRVVRSADADMVATGVTRMPPEKAWKLLKILRNSL